MPKRPAAIALGVILLVAAGLRLKGLDTLGYWFDEGFTVDIVRDGLGHLADTVPRTEFTPPLYYLSGWAWASVFGIGEMGLRLLSALFGIAAVGAVYLAGERLVDRRTGLAAAALCAVNPLLVWYSQEARSYSLLVLLSALTMLGMAEALREEGRRRGLVGWAVAAGLALCTHYFALFLVVPQAALLLWRRRERAMWVAVGAVGAVGLALVPLAIHQHGNALLGVIEDYALSGRLKEMVTQLPGGLFAEFEGRHPFELYLYGAALVIFALTFRSLDRPARSGALTALGLAAAAICVPAVLALAGFDYVVQRNFVVALPALAIVLGAGLSSRRLAFAGPVVLAAILVVSVMNVVRVKDDYSLARTDWRGVQTLLGASDPHRALVTPFDGFPVLDAYRDTTLLESDSAPAEIDEIVFIYGLADAIAPPPGFDPGEQQTAGGYVLQTYRSQQPQRLNKDDLLAGVDYYAYGGQAAVDRPDGATSK